MAETVPSSEPFALPCAVPPTIHYSARTCLRAERAFRCSPFRLALFAQMITQGVELQAIAGAGGLKSGYTRRRLSELTAETELLWLIQVGLLRREVDGQGLTDSFRITPLGRQLIFPALQTRLRPLEAAPSWGDRLYNSLSRWLRWPF